MNNVNVKAFVPPVNPLEGMVDDACNWLTDFAVRRSDISAGAASLRISAVTSLLTVLTPEESRRADWVLANLTDIARRWATRNSAMKSDTARTYESRARAVLATYLRWAKEPLNFKFSWREDGLTPAETKERRAGRRTAEAPPAPPVVEAAVDAVAAEEVAASQPPPLPPVVLLPAVPSLRTLALGKDKNFKYELPESLTIVEVTRITIHLATHALDFDAKLHTQVFPG
jgi:hypothetical protein